MTNHATALALAARGFEVFPIKAGAKFPPLWKEWPGRSSATIPANWPDGANVGVHCTGLIVLDVDVKNRGYDSLLALELGDTPLPATLEASTPSGGRHLFYRLPDGHPGVPNRAGALGPGIDIKSTRGYVLGVGSRTAAGEYVWQNPDVPIAPAPEWLLTKLGTIIPKEGTAPAASVPDADEATVERAHAWLDNREGATEGQGGDAHTFATAAFLRDYGLSERQALTLMLDWNADCSPPWLPNELGVKVHNAYSYGQGVPGAKAVTAADFPNYIPDQVQSAPVLLTSGAVIPNGNKPPKEGAIRLDAFATSRVEGPGYLVKGLLTRGSYAELYGSPGAGKTFVALDIAYHVAAGSPWMEHRIHQGCVLYLAYEGTGGLVKRAQALRQHYGTADVPLYVTAADYNLRNMVGRQALGCVIATLPEKPALIVVDTFARALMGGDENSAQDVGDFNNAVQALIESTGACVLILHHTGKDKSRGPRGSSALQGAVDTEIEIDGYALTPTKQRDIETGEAVGFKLVPLAVGVDEDGDAITSCVVQQSAILGPTDIKLNGNQRAGWDVLCKLRPSNEPITLDDWKAACREFLGGRDLGRRFYDIKSRLENTGLIVVTDNLVTRRLE